MELVNEKIESKKDKRLEMVCECCGEKIHRWDMEIVEPEDCVFEANQLMKDFGNPEMVEYNFACPACVTELCLIPLQTDRAKLFRDRNEKLRKVLAPTPIH